MLLYNHHVEFAIAHSLRSHGWIVPAYNMAPHLGNMTLLRVVVREDFSLQRARMFLRDLLETIQTLDNRPAVVHEHVKEIHQQRIKSKAAKSHKHSGANDTHSLQGKHGKTHGVC
jgi:glutamate decarboxylase